MYHKDLKNRASSDINRLSPPPEKVSRTDMDKKHQKTEFYNILNCQSQPVFLSNPGAVYSSAVPVYQTPSPPEMGVNFPMNFLNKKMDTTNHYHIFVGDLAPEIESKLLLDAFSNFGFVTECKIIKDMHTQKPKGYGFVSYATKEEAELAIQMMNGQMIGSRTIRTGWAVRKPNAIQPKDQKPLNYAEVINASSESNCTVYVGGITKGLTEDALRDAFKEFGEILEVRVFKDKGYSFLRFDTHEGAARAIITMHGQEVVGQPCKCSWGKESSDVTSGSIQSYITSLSKQALMLGQFGILPNVSSFGGSSAPSQNFKTTPTLSSCPSLLAAAAASNGSVPTSFPKQFVGNNNSMALIQGMQLPNQNGNPQIPTSVCMRSIQHISQNSPFVNAPTKSTSNMILSNPQNPIVYQNQQLCNFFNASHPSQPHQHPGSNQAQIIPTDLLLQNGNHHPQNGQQSFSSSTLNGGHQINSMSLNAPGNINFFPQNELIPIGSAFIPIKSQ